MQFYKQVLEGGESDKGDSESSGNTRRNGCLSGTSLRRVRNLALEPQSHSWVRGRRLGGLCLAHPVCCRPGEEADGSFIIAWCLAPSSSLSAMEPRKHELKNGRVLLIRQVAVEDARALLDYVEHISGESDFLSFGPGEFELTESEEEEFIRQCLASDNQLYILGLIDDTIVATLNFSGGCRPRVRDSG